VTLRHFADRSRHETLGHCARHRWLGYHESGRGLQPKRLPLPLAVGLSVHTGLAEALRHPDLNMIAQTEESAVYVALEDFAKHSGALDIGSTEAAAMQPSQTLTDALRESLLATGTAPDDPLLNHPSLTQPDYSQQRFNSYLVAEQTALVEAMVRAYCRRRLRPLLEQFEVLEVEREGQWPLGEFGGDHQWDTPDADFQEAVCRECGMREAEAGPTCRGEMTFMSRPDALLRERATGHLHILSYKTAASWDVRQARSAEHDMQGLSEGVEIERRLADWWDTAHNTLGVPVSHGDGCSQRMFEYLQGIEEPPRVMAVRYEYLLKGDRWTDKDLTRELGMEVRSQRSPLVRGYFNAGMVSGDEQWNVAWEYLKESGTGETSKLYWKNWRSTPVWEHMTVKRWIDMLDDTAPAVSGETGGELGWKSDAQATGYLPSHPLDDQFIPPVTVYRQDDDLRDMVEQLEAGERRVAEAVAAVRAAADEGERRHLLNVHFPQTRRACYYPTECTFTRVCYGGEDIRRDPLASGYYKERELNHPQEGQP